MKTIRILAAAAVSAAMLYSPSARADEVNTKDGSTFHGELVERVNGDHITLKLATGEVKLFRWNDIDFKSATGAAGTQISLESDRENTTLMRLASAGTGFGSVGGRGVAMTFESYEPVCTAPCRAAGDPNSTYIVAGEGVTPSPKFRLPREPEAALRVHGGSLSKRSWGAVSLLSGISIGLLGGTMFALGAVFEPDPSDSKYSGQFAQGNLADDQGRASTFKTIGYIGIGSGVALLALGITLIATSGTDVFTPSGQIAKRALPLPGKLTLTPTGFVF